MFNISISSALSSAKNWDPEYSLDIAKKKNIRNFQLYLGDNLSDKNLCKDIITKYKDINFILHSPVSLNRGAVDKGILERFKIFVNEGFNKIVFHHDPDISVSDALEIISILNKEGIEVLLENYYPSYDQVELRNTIESFKRIVIESHFSEMLFVPLIDIPRLFIKEINSILNPLDETISLINLISSLGSTIYLHIIDCKNDLQDRPSWCPVGRGYIPYDKIFRHLVRSRIDMPLICS